MMACHLLSALTSASPLNMALKPVVALLVSVAMHGIVDSKEYRYARSEHRFGDQPRKISCHIPYSHLEGPYSQMSAPQNATLTLVYYNP
jgi:hypothetical protein